MFYDYRVNGLTIGGVAFTPAAEDFLSISLPADYQLDGAVGAATQVLSEVTDKSCTITATLGSMSLMHAQMAVVYQSQQAARAAGGSPVQNVSATLANGDKIVGIGVVSKPTTIDGGTQSGTRAWTIMLQRATYTPAVGLAEAIAAAGTP